MAGGVQVSKPVVVFTRPADWATGGYASERLELVHVAVSGPAPVKRNGRPAGDGIGDVVTKAGADRLVAAVKERRPDILFHSIHAKIGEGILSRVRDFSPKTRIVVMDGNDPDRVGRYTAGHRKYVDAVLLNSADPGTFAQYRRAGFGEREVGTLHDGFVPGEHPGPPPGLAPRYDCFFAGSNILGPKGVHLYPNGHFRQRFMLAVRGGFKLALHGYPGEWGPWVLPRLHYPEYYRAFHCARIALNVNHLDLERYYTRRTIHAGASGRLYLVRYVPGMERDFGENGEHVAWFRSIEEGMALIGHYLENGEERERAAARCRKLFLERHTWRARLAEFEEFALRLLGR